MAVPLLELEGTWDEMAQCVPDFAEQKLHVIVLPANDSASKPGATRPIADVFAEIAAGVPADELAKILHDFSDQLDHYIYGGQ